MSLLPMLLGALGLLPDAALSAGARLLFSGSWKRFMAATAHPREIQIGRLLMLVERAKGTAFGQAHDFGSIKTLEDYQTRVPIRGWDELDPYIQRMLKGEANVLLPDAPFFYGRSSGTTGAPKHVPVTPAYVAEYRLPRRVWARQVMQAFPGLLRGKILSIHSPRIEGKSEGGVPYGSITVGLTTKPGLIEGPLSGSPLDAVPKAVFLLEDFELKYYVILRLAAQSRISLAAAVNPSTLVLLAKKLDEHAVALAEDLEAGTLRGLDRMPEPIRSEVAATLMKAPLAAAAIRKSKAEHGYVVATDLWPGLVGLLCWKGGSAPFYLDQLGRWFPSRPIMDYGFLATEGGFSIPLSPEGSSGVVAVLGSVLEFVPEDAPDEPARLADALEVGRRYRVIITGSHGLYRYDIQDLVECTGYFQKTATIRFLHKAGNMLSVTGEKVGESHVVLAMGKLGLDVVGFSVSVELGDPPRYVLAIEPKAPLDPGVIEAFDRALGEVNLEYAAKRASLRLGPPRLIVLPSGAYDRARAALVKSGAPDAHVKPPHLLKDLWRLEGLGAS